MNLWQIVKLNHSISDIIELCLVNHIFVRRAHGKIHLNFNMGECIISYHWRDVRSKSGCHDDDDMIFIVIPGCKLFWHSVNQILSDFFT